MSILVLFGEAVEDEGCNGSGDYNTCNARDGNDPNAEMIELIVDALY